MVHPHPILTGSPQNAKISLIAGVAQLVERLLPKQNVTGSSPVTRFALTVYVGVFLFLSIDVAHG